MRAFSLLAILCSLCLTCAPSRADVRQCLGEQGSMVLTDAACPSGYREGIIVPSRPTAAGRASAHESTQAPPGSASPPQSLQQSPAGDRTETTPDTPARDLARLEAENRSAREALDAHRLERPEPRFDALDDRAHVEFFGVLPAPLIALPGARHCRCGDCAVRRPRSVERPDGGCGTFGCTPTLTRTPWDGERDPFARDLRAGSDREGGRGDSPRRH